MVSAQLVLVAASKKTRIDEFDQGDVLSHIAVDTFYWFYLSYHTLQWIRWILLVLSVLSHSARVTLDMDCIILVLLVSLVKQEIIKFTGVSSVYS